jgi:perosamine synthetase
MEAVYEPVVWLSSVLVPPDRRLELMSAAAAADIETRPFFHPLSMLPPYERYGRVCPVSRELSASGINLPTSRHVDEQVVERIARIFHDVLA